MNNTKMIIMMAVCCIAPVLIFSLLGTSFIAGQKWLLFGIIFIAFIAIHFFMMKKFHGHSNEPSSGENSNNSKKYHKDHGCH